MPVQEQGVGLHEGMSRKSALPSRRSLDSVLLPLSSSVASATSACATSPCSTSNAVGRHAALRGSPRADDASSSWDGCIGSDSGEDGGSDEASGQPQVVETLLQCLLQLQQQLHELDSENSVLRSALSDQRGLMQHVQQALLEQQTVPAATAAPLFTNAIMADAACECYLTTPSKASLGNMQVADDTTTTSDCHASDKGATLAAALPEAPSAGKAECCLQPTKGLQEGGWRTAAGCKDTPFASGFKDRCTAPPKEQANSTAVEESAALAACARSRTASAPVGAVAGVPLGSSSSSEPSDSDALEFSWHLPSHVLAKKLHGGHDNNAGQGRCCWRCQVVQMLSTVGRMAAAATALGGTGEGGMAGAGRPALHSMPGSAAATCTASTAGLPAPSQASACVPEQGAAVCRQCGVRLQHSANPVPVMGWLAALTSHAPVSSLARHSRHATHLQHTSTCAPASASSSQYGAKANPRISRQGKSRV